MNPFGEDLLNISGSKRAGDVLLNSNKRTKHRQNELDKDQIKPMFLTAPKHSSGVQTECITLSDTESEEEWPEIESLFVHDRSSVTPSRNGLPGHTYAQNNSPGVSTISQSTIFSSAGGHSTQPIEIENAYQDANRFHKVLSSSREDCQGYDAHEIREAQANASIFEFNEVATRLATALPDILRHMKQSEMKINALTVEVEARKQREKETIEVLARLNRTVLGQDSRLQKFEQAQIDQMLLAGELTTQPGGAHGGPAAH